MKSIFSLVFIVFATFSSFLMAQNTNFLASTSVSLLAATGSTTGFGKAGFTTITGAELKLRKNLWLTASADFQSIAYRQTSSSLDIDQSLSLIPLMLGGRFLFVNTSKLTPYVSASAGVTILSIPRSEVLGSQTHIYAQTCFPFTYGFRGGVQYQVKSIFFPFLEIGRQTLLNSLSPNPLSFVAVSLGLRTYPF